MARISHLPAPEVIFGFRGVLDYACWRGILYVRKWPRTPTLPRSPAVQQSAAAFAALSKQMNNTAPIMLQFADAAGRPHWTWKDVLTSAAYGNVIL